MLIYKTVSAEDAINNNHDKNYWFYKDVIETAINDIEVRNQNFSLSH